MSSGDDHRMDIDAKRPIDEKHLSSITPELVQSLYSEDVTIQLEAVQKILQLISDPPNQLCENLIKSGAVPRFVHFLEDFRYPVLQLESVCVLIDITFGSLARAKVVIDAGAVPVLSRLLSSPNEKVVEISIWALGNIAIGNTEYIQAVIDAGAVPVLVKLLTTSLNDKVFEKSIWALGNIAFDSTESRDLVLNNNVLPPLLGLFSNNNASLSMRRIATATLRTLCDKKPPPNFEQISQCIPLLARLIVNQDAEILENVCCVLASFCVASNEQIQVVIDSGVCPRAVQLLGDTSNAVVSSALYLVGYIVTGTVSQTQVLIQANAVPALGSLLSHEKKSIVKEACKALSNITYGSIDHIQVLIDSGVCPRVIQLLSHTSTEVVKAALGLVGDIARGNDSQTQVVINTNALPVLGSFLSHEKDSIVKNACRTLSNITAGNEQQIQAVLDASILPSLIELLCHGDVSVRKQATWAISNATAKGSEEQIARLVDAGAIPPLCKLLSERDSNLIDAVLAGLEEILRTGESFAKEAGSTVNPYATFVKQCDGFEKMTFLSSHYEVMIAQKASAISKMYVGLQVDGSSVQVKV